MKNSTAARRPKSTAKGPRRKPQPGWWSRMPRRQRERLIRIGMWIFLVLFVLSVAGGLILTTITKVQVK